MRKLQAIALPIDVTEMANGVGEPQGCICSTKQLNRFFVRTHASIRGCDSTLDLAQDPQSFCEREIVPFRSQQLDRLQQELPRSQNVSGRSRFQSLFQNLLEAGMRHVLEVSTAPLPALSLSAAHSVIPERGPDPIASPTPRAAESP